MYEEGEQLYRNQASCNRIRVKWLALRHAISWACARHHVLLTVAIYLLRM